MLHLQLLNGNRFYSSKASESHGSVNNALRTWFGSWFNQTTTFHTDWQCLVLRKFDKSANVDFGCHQVVVIMNHWEYKLPEVRLWNKNRFLLFFCCFFPYETKGYIPNKFYFINLPSKMYFKKKKSWPCFNLIKWINCAIFIMILLGSLLTHSIIIPTYLIKMREIGCWNDLT